LAGLVGWMLLALVPAGLGEIGRNDVVACGLPRTVSDGGGMGFGVGVSKMGIWGDSDCVVLNNMV
jgi:hypothetical protein